jgi:hypothetical protein
VTLADTRPDQPDDETDDQTDQDGPKDQATNIDAVRDNVAIGITVKNEVRLSGPKDQSDQERNDNPDDEESPEVASPTIAVARITRLSTRITRLRARVTRSRAGRSTSRLSTGFNTNRGRARRRAGRRTRLHRYTGSLGIINSLTVLLGNINNTFANTRNFLGLANSNRLNTWLTGRLSASRTDNMRGIGGIKNF